MPNKRLYVLVFLLLFLPYSYFDHNDGGNQLSRIAALHAITLRGTIAIDDYGELTGDKAFINGHYYSEKAPAMALLALPSFAATVGIQKMMGIDPDSTAATRWSATRAASRRRPAGCRTWCDSWCGRP